LGCRPARFSGLVVLDVDVKRPEANGFDSLEDLGHSIATETSIAHTEAGGLHIYFRCPQRDVRNSASRIGAGLDVRANGGYVILPSPASGYDWDSIWNFETVEPVEAPDWLWPAPASRSRILVDPPIPTTGLSRYAEASLDAACNAIMRAPAGQQEQTLNSECFSIGTLVGGGRIPEGLALKALLYAANKMPNHDPRWPWRTDEIDYKVRRAFADGLVHPRQPGVRRAG
jgi:Bifunctional DNA primase/polymerase, N-terminal